MTLKQSSAVHIQALVSADGILPGSSSKLRLLIINLASVPGGQLVNSPTAQSLERCAILHTLYMIRSFSIFSVLGLIILSSCINLNKNHDVSIEKVWQWSKYSDSTYFYKVSNDIDQTEGGFQFLNDGKLKVRQNIGWCGTPPISYETVLGSWNKISDNTIRLNYPYWGGKIVEDILIVKISNSELQFKSVNLKRLK